MNLKFNKKTLFILILCISIICVSMIIASNNHNANNKINNFVDAGEEVYCDVGFNEFMGFHWNVTTCEGLKFVSDKVYKSNDSSSRYKYVQRFTFKKELGEDDDHIILTQYGLSGEVIQTYEYRTPLKYMG